MVGRDGDSDGSSGLLQIPVSSLWFLQRLYPAIIFSQKTFLYGRGEALPDFISERRVWAPSHSQLLAGLRRHNQLQAALPIALARGWLGADPF